MKFRFFLALFMVLFLLPLFLTGCSQQDQLPERLNKVFSSDKSGNWVKMGVYGDPLSLNPVGYINSEHGQIVDRFVHASALRKLADGTFEPYLFDSFSVFKGASGTIVLEGVWKSNLKWHDGHEFDPRDLEYTIELIKKSENHSPWTDLVKGIESVSNFGRGQRTRIVFKSDSRSFLELLTVGIVPSHVVGDQPLERAKVEIEGVASESWPLFEDQPIGLGPFKVASRQKGSYLELQPHDEFYDNASRSSVLVRSYFEYHQLVSDFRSGRLNWIDLPSMLFEQLESMKVDNAFYIKYPNPATMVWLFNTRSEFLSDKRLRQALDKLADRNKILNQVPFAGFALYEMPAGKFSTEAKDYNSSFKQALDLLDETGWKDSDADGIRDLNGKKLQLTLVINEDNLLRRAVAEDLVKDCRRAGIELNVQAVSWSEFVSGKLQKKDFDTALLSIKIPEFGNAISLFHSQAQPSATDSESDEPAIYQKLNFSGIADSELDESLEALDSILPVKDADTHRAKIKQIIDDNKPMAFLFKPCDIGMFHAESGQAVASEPIWNDVRNWKLLFGSEDSML
jgi:peptide/nickel transport system substrate-binding protein